MFNMESIDCKVKCYLNLFNKIRKINNNLLKYSKTIERDSIIRDFKCINVRLKPIYDNMSEKRRRVQQIDNRLNKNFKCFWPKCGFSAKVSRDFG